ncbi:electron transport complex subunit E [Porticoccaceae bacterium LTM1]|nr:electron transport complex subunit E [Porticoccaceae bacterium LTM1]
MATSYREVVVNGLWKNNPALVQLLGLCPLLAVTSSIVNALGLGLATLLVLTGSNIVVSLVRSKISDAVRLPAFVMIIATFTTCTELLMKAYTYELYLVLGIFIPLIVTNCAILGRAEAFASKNSVLPSALDGLMMGMGFAMVLLAVGAVREVLGSGTLFANMQLLFGSTAADWTIHIFPDDYAFLVAILPPGAFLVTGLLIALKNSIDQARKKRAEAKRAPVKAGSKRVRTTEIVGTE